MTKKKANNNKKENVVTSNELINLIKIIVVVCVVLLAFYFITVLVNKNKKSDNFTSDDTIAIIQYDKIIVGEILNRPEEEYYVLVKKENDVNYDLYQSYLSIYSGKENALRVYNVDLSEVFNSNAIGEETNINTNIENFKFSDSTFIKIKNRTIENVFIGEEQIENHLKGLIK